MVTNQDLAGHVHQMFGEELATVQDEVLREKVLRTWVRAMALAGATDLMHDLPMVPEIDKPGIGVDHIRGVVRVSLAIADALNAAQDARLDRDIVAAGALLHDVGKVLEHAPPDRHPLAGTSVSHAFSGMELALQEDLPKEILHIIAYHSREGQLVRRSPECDLIYRADSLSADVIYRRELGKSRNERTPYVYVPR